MPVLVLAYLIFEVLSIVLVATFIVFILFVGLQAESKDAWTEVALEAVIWAIILCKPQQKVYYGQETQRLSDAAFI